MKYSHIWEMFIIEEWYLSIMDVAAILSQFTTCTQRPHFAKLLYGLVNRVD